MSKQAASILLVINSDPASSNAYQAWSLCAALQRQQQSVHVFFNQQAVTHAQAPAALERDCLALHTAYAELALAASKPVSLLVCRAAWTRRSATALASPWQSSGLAELAELTQSVDRIVSFS